MFNQGRSRRSAAIVLESWHALGRITSERAAYEALRLLLDWLNTLFTLLPKVGRTAMAARARNTSNRAYSTRSCPSSSRMNLLISSRILCSPFGGYPYIVRTVPHDHLLA